MEKNWCWRKKSFYLLPNVWRYFDFNVFKNWCDRKKTDNNQYGYTKISFIDYWSFQHLFQTLNADAPKIVNSKTYFFLLYLQFSVWFLVIIKNYKKSKPVKHPHRVKLKHCLSKVNHCVDYSVKRIKFRAIRTSIIFALNLKIDISSCWRVNGTRSPDGLSYFWYISINHGLNKCLGWLLDF